MLKILVWWLLSGKFVYWWKSWCLIGLCLGLQLPVIAEPVVPNSAETQTQICPQDLPKAITEIINRPDLSRSRWGMLIQTLATGQTLYSLEAEKFFIPASNVKLLTTAAALRELGADFRVYTPVYGSGQAPDLDSLRLKGQGDPTITTNVLKKIVHQLRGQGVNQIKKLIIDDSYFSDDKINPTWEWSDLYSYYATAVTSVILNQNSTTLTLLPQQLNQPIKLKWSDAIAARQWRVENEAITSSKGSPNQIQIEGVLGQPSLKIRGNLAVDSQPDVWDLAVVDPANYFLESFRKILSTQGIIVKQGIVSNETKIKEQEIATIISPSLPEIITEINQSSNNLYAEALIQILSKKLKSDSALESVVMSLTKLGIEPESYILTDASGLSRQNLVTPKALVQTLRLMMQTPVAETYQNSLAVAGLNGTLKQRFKHTPVQGHLRGKTGTLSGVSTLAGYLEPPGYQPLAISIMVNNSHLDNSDLRNVIDEIVLRLERLSFCSINP